MNVIKKSDLQEKFSYEKLAGSIQAANAEAGENLDIELLLMEFQNIAVNMDEITTGQIKILVYGLLYSKGALQTLEKYSGYGG